MAGADNSTSPQGKKDRREAARETARLAREAEKKRQRRNRLFVQGGIGAGVIAVVAIVALIIVNSTAPASPGPKNMLSDGILISGPNLQAVKTAALTAGAKPVVTDTSKLTKKANIVTYIDYQCPYCDQFETTNSAQMQTWIKAGEATLEIHPISILDNSSLGSRYSTRAANAAACVANYDPNNFFAVNSALFASQPAEQTTGLTDAKILAVLKTAGSSSGDITSCVTSEKFSAWVAAASTRVTSATSLPNSKTGKFNGTPTVLVNGAQYAGSLTDANAFGAFVTQQLTAG